MLFRQSCSRRVTAGLTSKHCTVFLDVKLIPASVLKFEHSPITTAEAKTLGAIAILDRKGQLEVSAGKKDLPARDISAMTSKVPAFLPSAGQSCRCRAQVLQLSPCR